MNKDEILFLSSEYNSLKLKPTLSTDDDLRLKEIEKILINYALYSNVDNTRLIMIIDDDGELTYKLPNQVSDQQKQFFVNSHLIANPSWFLKLVLLIEALLIRFLHFSDL
jgi:hypothetical protein